MCYSSLNKLPLSSSDKTGWPWTQEVPSWSSHMPDGSSWPMISIVTPSFNQGTFIEETIRSLVLQGYPNLEYIIVDGGSTDETVDIIKKYEPWITYWVSEPDRGQTDAVNKGFLRSNGEILAWLNSDDTFEPGALHSIAIFMARNPKIDVVYGNVKIIDEYSHKLTELRSVPFNAQAFLYETVHIAAQSAVFWKRQLFFDVGMLDEAYSYAMDRHLLVKFIAEGARFGFLRKCLGTYRVHGSSKTFGTADKSKQELLKIQEIAKVRERVDYLFWRFVFRARQFVFLFIQGDIFYILLRFWARFRPSAFDSL